MSSRQERARPVTRRAARRHGSRLATRLLGVALLALTGCASAQGGATPPERHVGPAADSLGAPTTAPAQHLPVTVRSADGRDVTVTDTSRIVPLFADINELVFQLGFGDRVVARDVSTTFAEAADLPVVTRAHDVSAESVLSLRPTLVLADDQTGPPEALAQLRSVGVPVVVLKRPTSLADVAPNIEAVAAALGVPQAGAALARRTVAELDALRATARRATDPPRVAFLYLRGSAGVALLGGPGAGPDSLIDAAGGVDAGTAMGLRKAFTPITSEALVQAAPEVLLLTTSGLESVGGIDGLLTIPGIAQTPAGRNRRVITIEDGLLFSFGSRSADALRQLMNGLTVP